MLKDVWLLSDLDGTLISTPHKARGQYPSLGSSPCFETLKRWLLNGGNVCIVTTADKRVFDQVYAALRPFLPNHSRESTQCGELLLSIYTGAVLYRCTADRVENVKEYAESMHCATGESVELAGMYGVELDKRLVKGIDVEGHGPQFEACVHGTCFSLRICCVMVQRLEGIFFAIVEDALREVPVVMNGLTGMSARYKQMWSLLLSYLDGMYTAHTQRGGSAFQKHKEGDRGHVRRDAKEADEVVQWKMRFLRQRRGLCAALGIIRMELAEATDAFPTTSSHTFVARETEASRAILRALCHPVEAHTGNEGDPSKNTHPVVGMEDADVADASRRFAKSMSELLCAGAVPDTPGAGDERRIDVAQVILLGVPIRLFSRYFASHLAAFVGLGVTAIPQPNSVVFSKMGVCKSTAIRYLLGKERCVNDGSDRLRGVVRRGAAVAMGDNPQSTDYELTVFPRLPFVSVERAEQRRARHERIDERKPPPNVTRRRGPLMDDRCVPHLRYVGREEDGSAAFLTRLMDLLRVPPLAHGVEGDGGVSSVNGRNREAVTPITFAEAVRCAALDAQRSIQPLSAHL